MAFKKICNTFFINKYYLCVTNILIFSSLVLPKCENFLLQVVISFLRGIRAQLIDIFSLSYFVIFYECDILFQFAKPRI